MGDVNATDVTLAKIRLAERERCASALDGVVSYIVATNTELGSRLCDEDVEKVKSVVKMCADAIRVLPDNLLADEKR